MTRKLNKSNFLFRKTEKNIPHRRQKKSVRFSNENMEIKTPTVFVKPVFRDLDWKYTAAKYMFRISVMEDYLLDWIVALASYRKVTNESLEDLSQFLVSSCDSRSKENGDIAYLMPPHISGLVYNKTILESDGKRSLNVKELLFLKKDVFRIFEDRVFYLRTIENPYDVLQKMLAEGLFIYFLAKFCHGAKFAIKVSYYQKSEPIRSALIYATGCSKIATSLKAYFETYSTIFIFKNDFLTMTSDYFDKNFKTELKTYLEPSKTLSGVVGTLDKILRLGVYVLKYSESGYAVLHEETKADLQIGSKIKFDAVLNTEGTNGTDIFKWKVSQYQILRVNSETFTEDQKLLKHRIGSVRIALSSTSGLIQFSLDSNLEEAYFTTDVVDEKITLEQMLNRQVHFNALRQISHRGVKYRCTQVILVPENKEMNSNLEDTLEKVDTFLGEPTFVENDQDNIVRSVIESVFSIENSYVESHETIINKLVVDSLIRRMSLISFHDSQTKIHFLSQFETEVRKLFSKMVTTTSKI